MVLLQKLAALSVIINDAMQTATGAMTPSGTAALITTLNRAPLIISEIAESTGLTHSATVRLVDRLERQGLLRRQQRQGRTVLVDITPGGRQRALELIAARNRAVIRFLAPLTESERSVLGALLNKIIGHQLSNGISAAQMCRYCQQDACDCLPLPGARTNGDGLNGAGLDGTGLDGTSLLPAGADGNGGAARPADDQSGPSLR